MDGSNHDNEGSAAKSDSMIDMEDFALAGILSPRRSPRLFMPGVSPHALVKTPASGSAASSSGISFVGSDNAAALSPNGDLERARLRKRRAPRVAREDRVFARPGAL